MIELFSCNPNAHKLTQKGWEKFRANIYSKAEKKFNKALKQQPNYHSANHGLALINENRHNINDAYRYEKRAFENNNTSIYAYNMARYCSKIGIKNSSLQYLYWIFYQDDFEKWRLKAITENDFNNIKDQIKFQRWLARIRRIKVNPIQARTNDYDGSFDANDMFVTVAYANRLILSTKTIKNNDTPKWNNDYVVFDYNVTQKFQIALMEEDEIMHDQLLFYNQKAIDKEYNLYQNLSSLRFSITDTEEEPYSTTIETPARIDTTNFFMFVGGSKLASKSDFSIHSAPLNSTYLSNIIKCAMDYKANTLIENPSKAGIATDALIKVLGQYGLNMNSRALSDVKSYWITELRNNRYDDIAQFIDEYFVGECFLINKLITQN